MVAKNPYDTKFNGYGFGWFISDVKGHRQIQHTGGLIRYGYAIYVNS